MALFTFLSRTMEQSPEKVYLRFEDEQITYEQLHKRIGKMASGLFELGIQKNDKVCIMMNNCPEYLDVWFSLSSLGAISVPINVHLKGEGLQYILFHSDCRVIIVDPECMPQVAACLTDIPRDITLVVRRAGKSSAEVNAYGRTVTELEDIRKAGRIQFPDLSVRPSDVNSILYTSGTTGLPKGVMLSHAAYIQAGQAFADHMVGATAEDVLFTTLPLFHINAQATTVLGGIHANATIALGKTFSASRFWDDIRFHKATIFNSLGSMIPILCKQPEKDNDRDNPAVRTACAATPKEFWKPFEERFGVHIVEGYGLTETTGFCISNPLHANRPPSFGTPFAYVEANVIDEAGKAVPDGSIGEIIIRPLQPHVIMEGYYKMPEKTEEAMKDGWFHTGDRGYRDEEGYFYFSDRVKQCIRRRGENISSWEIEKVVNNHPDVFESAAVGVPSDIGEEDVKLYVIVKPGEHLSPEEVMDWCQERMAYFMVPRYIEFLDSFPKTATERIQKFKLKEAGIGEAWDREKAGYVIKRIG